MDRRTRTLAAPLVARCRYGRRPLPL